MKLDQLRVACLIGSLSRRVPSTGINRVECEVRLHGRKPAHPDGRCKVAFSAPVAPARPALVAEGGTNWKTKNINTYCTQTTARDWQMCAGRVWLVVLRVREKRRDGNEVNQ